MASVVIASRNEPNWPQLASSFMGKTPSNNNNHNHNLISPNLNPNPNPNPNLFRGGGSRKGNHTATTAHHQNGGDFVNPTVSDDAASSFSRRPAGLVGESEDGLSHYVTYHISTCSRSDLRDLKARLAAELEQIRILSGRIETGELLTHPRGGVVKGSVKEKKVSGTKRAAPFLPMRKESKQRTASSSPPLAPVVTTGFSPVVEEVVPVLVGSEEVMKICKQLLNKLMRNKFCFWFNKPVDVEGMRLFDYYDIIKNPMDLGTVKSKLNRDAYSNPDEFAADVRLTFNNAMVYNPEGQEVHKYAKDLLSKFEAMFVPIAQRFDAEKQQHRLQVLQQQHVRQANQAQVQPRPAPPQVMPMPIPQPQIKPHPQPLRRSVVEQEMYHEKKQFVDVEKMDTEEVVEVADDELQGSSWSKIASPERPKKSSNSSKQQQQERQVETAPEHPPAQVVDANGEMGRASAPKLPKPKAKEPNKREMTMLEKHRLGTGLQNLPEEKMVHVVQIIRKRNGNLTQDGDEIELDIEAVDTETLWELDRFVTNYKKAASKLKRQVMMPISNRAQIESNMGAGVSERVARKGGGDTGEEDVDIGDEMPMSHFPPVEIEKDDEGQAAASGSSSRSSSSSSGSSSSSDSDSGSSSDSDSDVDDALSRDNGSKNFLKT